MIARALVAGGVLALLLGAYGIAGMTQSQRSPGWASAFQLDTQAAAQPYQLAARINLTQGFVKQAAWLDSDHFLTLLLSPDGAAVWRTSYSTLERDKFISSAFLEQYVCSAELTSRLDWTISPSKHFIFFNWFTNDGARQWTLIDISAAPDFKIKKFTPPEGMQIAKALFSPDDRYAVFVHDSFKQGSAVSLLAMDLQSGVECWRATTAQINFVGEMWWGAAVYDAPRFSLTAALFNEQSLEPPAVVHCDLLKQVLTLDQSQTGLTLGAEALWGKVACIDKGQGSENQHSIQASIPGQADNLQVPLSANPVALTLLPEPGLLLINNTDDFVTNQLWLVNVLAGDKYMLDADCAGYSIAADGKLLVRSRTNNELRIYEHRD